MPLAQASHEPLGCPTTGWYRPAAQPAHAAAPAAETDPAAHSLLHTLDEAAARAALYRPAAQAMQGEVVPTVVE